MRSALSLSSRLVVAWGEGGEWPGEGGGEGGGEGEGDNAGKVEVWGWK